MSASTHAAFREFFESAPGLYLVLSPDFKVIAVSNSYLDTTKTCRDELIGRDVFDTFSGGAHAPSPTWLSELKESLAKVVGTGRSDAMGTDGYALKNDAERHWDTVNTPVFDSERRIKYIVHQLADVSDTVRQRKANATLKSQVDHGESLRQSQRMEAMGQLAGGVAHDFNNLLGVITLTCDSALMAKSLAPEIKKKFETIMTVSERAAALTRQLLAFSRKQVLRPMPVSFNDIVRDMENLLTRLLNEDIELKTDMAADLGHALADRGQIEQILLNLVVNARDAMPHGGKITIKTANADLDGAGADGVLMTTPGRFVMLSVSDTGVGMDAATKARLFEPFFTTKGVGRGTGLGLATVYGIVSQGKGTIHVQSTPGKGATFNVYLPITKGTVDVPAATTGKTAPPPDNGSILVVEDQAELRELIASTLRDQGYQVTVAENGVQALEIAKQKQGAAFDLVITDVVMPGMSGTNLTEKLREGNGDIKVLYLSGYTDEALANYDISVAHPDFVEKPFTRAKLLEKVESILPRATPPAGG